MRVLSGGVSLSAMYVSGHGAVCPPAPVVTSQRRKSSTFGPRRYYPLEVENLSQRGFAAPGVPVALPGSLVGVGLTFNMTAAGIGTGTGGVVAGTGGGGGEKRINSVDERIILRILDGMMARDNRLPVRSRKWTEGGIGKAQAASGDEIVQWLLTQGHAKTASEAVDIATNLVRVQGLIPLQRVEESERAFIASSRTWYAHHALSVCRNVGGLNSYTPSSIFAEPRGALAVMRDLSAALGRLLPDIVLRKGLEVRYESIRTHPAWSDMLLNLSELGHCVIGGDDEEMSDDVKKACLYNLYNTMIINAKLVYGHPGDILARSRFFIETAFVIGGVTLNSVELENGVLRLKMGSEHVLSSLRPVCKDARMHFALNCGAQSCPPLRGWDPDNVEMELMSQTREFISHNVHIDAVRKSVMMSRLFKWFRVDFTPDSKDDVALLEWIAARAPDNIQELLTMLCDDARKGGSGGSAVRLRYALYDWGDNGDYSTSDTAFMSLYDLSFKRSA